MVETVAGKLAVRLLTKAVRGRRRLSKQNETHGALSLMPVRSAEEAVDVDGSEVMDCKVL